MNKLYCGAKYYSDSDLSIAANLSTAKAFLDSHNNLEECSDINEILELRKKLCLLGKYDENR